MPSETITSPKATVAPSEANNLAVASPIPRAAPVIMQTFPSNRPCITLPPQDYFRPDPRKIAGNIYAMPK